MSGKITTIYNDIPVLTDKVTIIHNKFSAIRNALERLIINSENGIFDRMQTNSVTVKLTISGKAYPCTIWAGSIRHAIR
jgi:hypothetical protein